MKGRDKFFNILTVILIKFSEEEEKIKEINNYLENFDKEKNFTKLLNLEEELDWERFKMNAKEILNLVKENVDLILKIRESFFSEERG